MGMSLLDQAHLLDQGSLVDHGTLLDQVSHPKMKVPYGTVLYGAEGLKF